MEKNTTMFNKKYLVVFIVLLVALMTVSVAADVTNTNTKSKVTKDTSKVTNTQKIVKTTENTKKIKTNKKDNITSKKTNSKTNMEVKKTSKKNVKKDSDTTDFYVSDNDGSDNNQGTSDAPFKTLQKAIDKAKTGKTNNIYIKTGLYKGLGNTNLTVDGDKIINFIGEGTEETRFDGEAGFDIQYPDPNTHEPYYWMSSDTWYYYTHETGNWFMNITSGNGQITVKDLTVTQMYVIGLPGTNWHGDGINLYPIANIDNYGTLTVDNVFFYQNYGGVGSAIRNNNNATLLVNNSEFTKNQKSSASGNNGIIYNNGTATIMNSKFYENYARWGTILNDKKITLINTTLENNIGYDGQSTYNYGAGFAYNTGDADFYNPGYFATDNTIINSTFKNNSVYQIYANAGKLTATGNKIITNQKNDGIILLDNNKDDYKFILKNNRLNSIDSTSSNALIKSSVKYHAVILSDNIINSKANNIELDGNNTIIENNTLISKSNYAVTFTSIANNNKIRKNTIVSLKEFGNNAVAPSTKNTIEANIPEITEKTIFVAPDITTAQEGTQENPTTFTDALNRVQEEGTIILIPNNNKDTITFTECLNINQNTILTGAKTFNITTYHDIKLNGQNTTRLFNITSGYTINFNNIIFENANADYGGAIYTIGNLTLSNTTFKNNYANYGGSIYAENATVNIIGENIFDNNTATVKGGALALEGTNTTIDCENQFINNQVVGVNYLLGGAIYNVGNLTINGSNIFENNSITGNKNLYGAVISTSCMQGMIQPNHFNNIKIIGTNIFNNNKINYQGVAFAGCIYSYLHGNITIEGQNKFTNNQARGSGVLYQYGRTLKVTGENIFKNNAALQLSGGALQVTSIDEVIINGSIFENNQAINSAAGILISLSGNENLVIIENNTFLNNTANEGVAINISTTGNYYKEIIIRNNSFINNTSNNETISVTFKYIDSTIAFENYTTEKNVYINTAIGIEESILTSELDGQTITQNTPIPLNISIILTHPEYYDSNILENTNYEIYVNDINKYNTTSKDTTITEKYSAETDGKLNIYVKIPSYNLETNNININILKPIDTTLEITTTTESTVNKTTPITIIIKDENGQIIPGVEVTISTANKNETITLENGVIVYNYTPTTLGTETIIVTYAGNGTLNPSNQTNTLKVTVNKDEVIEELTNTTQEQEKTIAKQENTIKEEQKKVDTLNKTVETQKQDIEKLEEKVEKLTEKTKTQLTISKATATVGKKVTINVTVKDADGKAVTGGKVSLKVNGKVLKDSNNNIIYADVSKGVASIKYLVPGSWIKQNPKIEAVYTGDDKYADSTVTKTGLIKVQKGSTNITLTPNIKSTKAGQKVTINVKHIDTNTKKGLTSKVAVKVNGKTFKVKVKNGEGVLTYTVPAGMNAKTVKVTASHSSKYYNKATSKTSFKVTKTTPTIKTTKTTYKSKKTTIKGKILDANNKVLTKNVKVTVKVDGKVVLKNKVVKKGKINLSFKKSLKKGYHELVITSKATKAFNKASFTGVLKV